MSHASGAAPNDLAPLWMPFTPNDSFKRRPRMISRAKGMHYFTPDGREILDATAGLWCCNAGHSRDPIVKAVQDQVAELDFAPVFQYGHPKAFETASRIAALAPGDLNHVFFANSGSESVDSALKIALAYHRYNGQGTRTRFIGRERGYHGVGFGGISVGGMVNNRKFFGPLLAGTDHLPHTYNRKEQAFTQGEPTWGAHLADELENIVALHDASTIAAVIVEPMAGSTGVLPPPQGYLERLRTICDKHGILLIFDEVITAFGRLGAPFAAERYGVIPDMICFAKGITSGVIPMGGVIARDHVHDVVNGETEDHEIRLFHGYTYSAHPMACAAALATLNIYRDEGLFDNSKRLERVFGEACHRLRAKHSSILDIRTLGLASAFDIAPIEGKPGKRGYEAVEYAFHDVGIMLRISGDTICLTPPLIATEDDIAEMVEKTSRVIAHIS